VGLSSIYLTEASPVEATFIGASILVAAIYGVWWLEFRNGGV
jgi:hypothetical protein